jgi:hypothetical protein
MSHGLIVSTKENHCLSVMGSEYHIDYQGS